MSKLIHTQKKQKGASMIEYAIIVALVVIGAVTVLSTLGTDIQGVFTGISTKLTDATP
ncbi:MAG: Flp family type IVb pilin [Limnobacter sp.]|nr:Flp family type IVb pilin [Limnobacter sp.]